MVEFNPHSHFNSAKSVSILLNGGMPHEAFGEHVLEFEHRVTYTELRDIKVLRNTLLAAVCIDASSILSSLEVDPNPHGLEPESRVYNSDVSALSVPFRSALNEMRYALDQTNDVDNPDLVINQIYPKLQPFLDIPPGDFLKRATRELKGERTLDHRLHSYNGLLVNIFKGQMGRHPTLRQFAHLSEHSYGIIGRPAARNIPYFLADVSQTFVNGDIMMDELDPAGYELRGQDEDHLSVHLRPDVRENIESQYLRTVRNYIKHGQTISLPITGCPAEPGLNGVEGLISTTNQRFLLNLARS